MSKIQEFKVEYAAVGTNTTQHTSISAKSLQKLIGGFSKPLRKKWTKITWVDDLDQSHTYERAEYDSKNT